MIEQYLSGVEQHEFEGNIKLMDAVIRRFGILGETVKQIPDDMRDKYPHIPWRQVAGMRDVLIHAYFGVNAHRLWLVVEKELPDLKTTVQRMIAEQA